MAENISPSQIKGEAHTTSWDGGPTRSVGLVRCCHCGAIWEAKPGSGKLRGFCGRCHGVTCGPLCPAGEGCVPLEEFLANKEQGRANGYRSIVVPFN